MLSLVFYTNAIAIVIKKLPLERPSSFLVGVRILEEFKADLWGEVCIK